MVSRALRPVRPVVFYNGVEKEAQLWGGGWIASTKTEVVVPDVINVSTAQDAKVSA